jgi:hypothetical protein
MHVGDVGTIIQLNLGQDVADATTIEFRFDPPRGATFVRTGAKVTTGSDGLVKYTTVAGDLTDAGLWKVQARIVTPSGEWYGDLTEFTVKANIEVAP